MPKKDTQFKKGQKPWNTGKERPPFDYNKKNCDPTNLITLCRFCHAKTNYNRNYWMNYFQSLC